MFRAVLIVLTITGITFIAMPAANAATPQEENAKLKQQLAELEEELSRAESELDRLRAALDARNDQVAKLISGKNAAGPPVATNDKGEKIDYSWNVDARTVVTNANVTRGGVTSTVSITDPDRLKVFGQFINKAKSPYRFRMKIMVYKKLSIPTKNPPVLGSVTYTTPTLKPRQGVNINEYVRVSSIYTPRQMHIVDVEALPAK